MHTDERLRHICRDVLLAVQIGDALGMPVEMMTPGEILAATNGEGVRGFIDPVQRRVRDTMDLRAGDTTDDWQLTRVVAESLIASGGYDQQDQAHRHIEAMRSSRFGWGGTTTKGIEGLVAGRDPNAPPPAGKAGSGCGNGVAMKIAPLALFHAVRNPLVDHARLLEESMALGRLTHPDPRASIAAYALATGIIRAVREPVMNASDRTMRARRDCFLSHVCGEAFLAEATHDLYSWPPSEWVSYRVFLAGIFLNDPLALRETVGTGCIAIESVPFSIATFTRHCGDFTNGVLEAVNAGGDTDSAGSMTGALIAANGTGRMPSVWKNALRDKGSEAMRLGDAIFYAARTAQ